MTFQFLRLVESQYESLPFITDVVDYEGALMHKGNLLWDCKVHHSVWFTLRTFALPEALRIARSFSKLINSLKNKRKILNEGEKSGMQN